MNCKQISELSTGSQITIGGDTGAVCTKQSDNSLKCSTSLASLTPGNGTIKITQGGVEKGSFNLNQSTGLTINLDTGSNITVSGTNDYLCTKQSDNSLKCSTDPANLIPGNGTITIKQGSKIMSFTLNQSTNTGIELDVGTYTGVTMSGYNTNSNNYCVAVNANTIECKSSGGSGSVGMTYGTLTSNKYCKYIEYTRDEGSIVCNYDAEGGSSDSLWKSQTVSANGGNQSVLTPNDTSNGLYLKQSVYYDSSLEFWGLSNYGFNRTRQLKLDPAGIRIGEGTSTYGYTGVGIGVLGAIGIGTFSNCDSNRLTMFASGNTETGDFEILGNNRLLVGVKNNSYLFLNSDSNVGINTTGTVGSTLNVKGSVKVGNCGKTKRVANQYYAECDETTVGQIRYVGRTDPGQFVGCIKSGTNYYRVSLSYGNNMVSDFKNSTDCTPSAPYNSSSYSQIGINLYQQCSL